MELTYILIAALIIVLPIILTKLLSGSRDAKKVLGAEPRTARASPSALEAAKAAALDAAKAAAADAAKAAAAAKMAWGNQESKIDAIKRLRDTGLTLKAAKDAVETREKNPVAAPPQGLIATIRHAQDVSDEVKKLVKQGKKIEAIKLIREQTGLGLKEAKDLVDRLG